MDKCKWWFSLYRTKNTDLRTGRGGTSSLCYQASALEVLVATFITFRHRLFSNVPIYGINMRVVLIVVEVNCECECVSKMLNYSFKSSFAWSNSEQLLTKG